MSEYTKPLPKIDTLNAPFWEGAQANELRLQKCGNCGKVSSEPSKLCIRCGKPALEWIRASGKGTIWSFGVFHKAYFPSFANDVPYNVVIVALDEGPKLYSNLVNSSNGAVEIGMKVKACFEKVTDSTTLVKFEPA